MQMLLKVMDVLFVIMKFVNECGGVKLKFYDRALLKDGRQGSVRAWFKNSQGENSIIRTR